MKAELQFFMSSQDTEAFLAFASNHIDRHEERENTESQEAELVFVVGDCELIFKPSRLIDNTLLIGSLSINSGGLDDGLNDQTRANNTYRQLRNWIKKHYYSRLSTWTDGNENKLSRTRNHWLGSDAKQWKQANPDAQLCLSENYGVFFDIAPEMGSMGGIEPKDEKFKPRG